MPYIYAMSDIHGHIEEFNEALKKVDLINQNNKLVLLGDYIDYGDYSCDVLIKIKELSDLYKEQVIVLFGNHEEMFLECLNGKGMPYIETIKSFFSEDYIEELKSKVEKGEIEKIDIINFLLKEIKKQHHELIKWLEELNNHDRYYENKGQIFVHAGINEAAKELWKENTARQDFTRKYPAEVGKFYKDIIAGHIGTWEIVDDESYHDIYFDGNSHYYIDGSVEATGVIQVLTYDTTNNKYIF